MKSSNELKIKYLKETVPKLKEELNYKNIMMVPRIEKVVINAGTGKFYKESEKMAEVLEGLKMITGQMPVLTRVRKAISGFKIREGAEVGVKVTLRGSRMWDFLSRLVNVAVPRTRDFQGITKSAVDQNGNLNLGVADQVVFPEISPEKIKNTFSFQICVTTTAKNQKDGLALFQSLGFPFKKD